MVGFGLGGPLTKESTLLKPPACGKVWAKPRPSERIPAKDEVRPGRDIVGFDPPNTPKPWLTRLLRDSNGLGLGVEEGG